MEKLKTIIIVALLITIVVLLSIILFQEQEPKIVYRPAPETESPPADRRSASSDYSKNQVRNTITKKWREMQQCYNQFLASDPKPEKTDGRIKVDWQVTAEGKVISPEIVTSEINHPGLEECLISRIRSWQFPPPPSGKNTYVVHKFNFKKTK